MKTNSLLCVIGSITLLVTSCSGGGGGSKQSFSMMFEAPGGSGLAAGEVTNVRFLPVVSRDISLPAGVVVTGVVRDEGGSPMSGVEVTFRSNSGQPEMDSDDTNGSGVYSVAHAGRHVARRG